VAILLNLVKFTDP